MDDGGLQMMVQLVFMDHGAVLESGPPRQVLAAPQHPRTAEFLAKVL